MSLRRYWALGVLALVILATASIRLRLLDVPLDRDEGEYAYFGQLLLEGVPPYAGAYNLKMPGIYGAYAAILALFGQTAAGVHAGLILATSATTALMYLLASRLFGPAVGVGAGAIFAVQALNPKLLGTAAYAEHFVLLLVVAGSLALLAATETRRGHLLFASGLLFGLAFLMKQSGAAFAVGAALCVVFAPTGDSEPGWTPRVRATVIFLGGVLVPFVIACLLLLVAGTFGVFWFWTVVYAAAYAADPSAGWENLTRALGIIVPSCSVILGLAAIGLGALARDTVKPRKRFLVLLLISSSLATAAGLHFSRHYFLLTLPAVALLAGLGLSALGDLLAAQRSSALRHGLPVVLASIALAQPAYASRDVLFELGSVGVSRAIYGRNPFPESVEIARYIRERTSPTDRVAVVGSEPQIYFYAGRRSATGYIYTYPLMELHPYASAMQDEMIGEIEASDPRYLVFVGATTSWLVRTGSNLKIFGWFDQYQRRFKRVGFVDIVSDRETVYHWGDEALWHAPRSNSWVMVFERVRQP